MNARRWSKGHASQMGSLINISFNVKGQPLIMSPDVALATFRSIGQDMLYMEGFIVWKT
jgi:carbamoyltransferase